MMGFIKNIASQAKHAIAWNKFVNDIAASTERHNKMLEAFNLHMRETTHVQDDLSNYQYAAMRLHELKTEFELN